MIFRIDNSEKTKNIKKRHQDPKINIDHINNKLLIYYKPQSDYAKYSISDYNGQIHINGEFKGQNTIIENSSMLTKNMYNLIIVDGEDLIQKQFLVD